MHNFYTIKAPVGIKTVYARLTPNRGIITVLVKGQSTPIPACYLADAQARVKARAKLLAKALKVARAALPIPRNDSLASKQRPLYTVLTQPLDNRYVHPDLCRAYPSQGVAV